MSLILDEISLLFFGDDVRKAAKELRKNDDIKIQHIAQVLVMSRELPIRCPYYLDCVKQICNQRGVVPDYDVEKKFRLQSFKEE